MKYFYAVRVVQIDKHLVRLYRQKRLFTINSRVDNGNYINWDDLKEKAEKYSLYEIALPHLEKVKQTGNRITALCPFHNEKTPSFTIYLEQNTYHCFGCQAHGNVITFCMKIDNLSFKEAVKELTK